MPISFGNEVTDFPNLAPGSTVGYIVAVDLQSNHMMKMLQVQAQDTSGAYSDIVSAAVSQAQLFAYLKDTNAPAIAFAQTSQIVFIFLNIADFPYVVTTRLGLWYWKNPDSLSQTSDYLDIPQEASSLNNSLAIRTTKLNAGKRIPFDVSQNIIFEKKQLALTA